MLRKGKLVVFEGIDGAGSTTQAELLFKNLESKGYRVVKASNPTESPIGKLIRIILQKKFKVSAATLQLLFCADRSNFLDTEVIPAINEGKIVVCDRYVFSTLAYGALELRSYWLKNIQKDFRDADITFLVDIPANVAMKRLSKRPNLEFFEKEKILQRVRKNYLELAKGRNVIVLDGTKPQMEIADEVLKIVDMKPNGQTGNP